MALKLSSYCPHLPSAVVKGMHHDRFCVALGFMLGKPLANWAMTLGPAKAFAAELLGLQLFHY